MSKPLVRIPQLAAPVVVARQYRREMFRYAFGPLFDKDISDSCMHLPSNPQYGRRPNQSLRLASLAPRQEPLGGIDSHITLLTLHRYHPIELSIQSFDGWRAPSDNPDTSVVRVTYQGVAKPHQNHFILAHSAKTATKLEQKISKTTVYNP